MGAGGGSGVNSPIFHPSKCLFAVDLTESCLLITLLCFLN